MSKKLLIAVTNRSSYNKVKTIIRNLPPSIEPILLLGGGINLYRFGQVDHIIERDYPDIPIYKIHLAVEGDDFGKMAKTVGLGIVEISTLLDAIRPDAVLTVADRFETTATAVAASFKNYPLIHLQGGERTGTIDNKVRNAITQFSDVHFPATEGAANRLSHLTDSEDIYMCGCPSMDLLVANADIKQIRTERLAYPYYINTLPEKERARSWLNYEVNMHGTGDLFDANQPFFIVMLHGDTTDKRFVSNMHGLPQALEQFEVQKLIFWNNIDPKGDIIAKMWREYQRDRTTRARFIRHVEPEVFGGLLTFASCIVGNSSSGIREANFMGTPAVNVGDRQHDREHGGNTITVPFTQSQIYDGIMSMRDRLFMPDNIYGHGNSGYRIARRIDEYLNGQTGMADILEGEQPAPDTKAEDTVFTELPCNV